MNLNLFLNERRRRKNNTKSYWMLSWSNRSNSFIIRKILYLGEYLLGAGHEHGTD